MTTKTEPKPVSLSRAADLLKCDRGTVRRAAVGLVPVGGTASRPLYNLDDLSKVLAVRGDRQNADVDRDIKLAKLAKLRHDLAVAEGKYISREELTEELSAVFARQRGILLSIEVQFPPLVAGRAADEIRDLFREEVVARFCREFRQWAQEREVELAQ